MTDPAARPAPTPDMPPVPRPAPDAAPAPTTADLAARIVHGDRRALARAITLVESTRADHRAEAVALLAALPPRQALRIGLSGTPGVGKSTFIETFGLMLTGLGYRVAVLAVDPSSARSGGSILGDKTRMERLSRDPAAFIRPSPSRAELGGVGRRTRETVRLTDLLRLLHERQRRGFRLGRDDLFLTLPDGTEVKFCHEEDIHVQAAGGTAAELLRASLSRYGA